MMQALRGVTVVECPGSVAIRYCGHLFAANGATVIQAARAVEVGVGYGGKASEAFCAWLDQGKRPAQEHDLDSCLRRASAVDLVIAGPCARCVDDADQAIERFGLEGRGRDGHGHGGDNARREMPVPLRIGITWFASEGPYRSWAGSDAVIQAMCGVAYSTGRVDGLPLLPRGHGPQILAGATAFVGAMAALVGRDAGWNGRKIDVDVLAANLCFYEATACGMALSGEKVRRRGTNRFTPTWPGGVFRASDGWIGVTALTPPQWAAFCDMAGVPALAEDRRYQVSAKRLDDADELEARLAPAIAQKTAAWWLETGQARRVPIAPVPDLDELPRTPHWISRGSFGPVTDRAGALGPTLPFRFDWMPDAVAQSSGGARTVSSGNSKTGSSGVLKTVPPCRGDRPLAGIRVLDLSMGWAGPLATRYFADFGADVIKVESCSHFDWWRGFDAMEDVDPPPWETRPSFLMVNRDKRGITLDLKAAQGKVLFERLAARADLLVENFAPGTLEKLGLGASVLASAVPGLITVSMGAFGQSGPWSSFRAYGSTVEQASGAPFVQGDAGEAPTMQHVAFGDPVGGVYGAAAGLIALFARQRAQVGGAVIDLGQVECLFQIGADAIVGCSVDPVAVARDGSRHPASLLRAVATGADGGWLAVSVESPETCSALCRLIGLDAEERRQPALEAGLRNWCAARDVEAGVAGLQRLGVAAGPVRAAQDLMQDPQLAESGFFQPIERRFVGRHWVTRCPLSFDGSYPAVRHPAPTLGEANTAVLGGELGLSVGELAELVSAAIIGTRAAGSTVSSSSPASRPVPPPSTAGNLSPRP